VDEADRIIEDGHFKEMEFILGYIYKNRVQFKKEKIEELKEK
jgi:superfamily II DNA/RNA helicase